MTVAELFRSCGNLTLESKVTVYRVPVNKVWYSGTIGDFLEEYPKLAEHVNIVYFKLRGSSIRIEMW